MFRSELKLQTKKRFDPVTRAQEICINFFRHFCRSCVRVCVSSPAFVRFGDAEDKGFSFFSPSRRRAWKPNRKKLRDFEPYSYSRWTIPRRGTGRWGSKTKKKKNNGNTTAFVNVLRTRRHRRWIPSSESASKFSNRLIIDDLVSHSWVCLFLIFNWIFGRCLFFQVAEEVSDASRTSSN
jgi:hypothetical protein